MPQISLFGMIKKFVRIIQLLELFEFQTNVALDLLKKEEVSAAIFAPGWVYETKQPPDFQTAQNR